LNKREIDIELIAKYYNGELDGKAMQRLEEQALDDPFLAEAMEGFSEFAVQKNDVSDLHERLKNRLGNPPEKAARVFGFRGWAIAASIVVLIGFISIYLNIPEDNKVGAVGNPPEIVNIPDQTKDKADTDGARDTLQAKQVVIDESPVIVSLQNPGSMADEVIASSDQIVLQEVPAAAAPAIDSLNGENVIAAYTGKSDDFTDNNMSIASRSAKVMMARSSKNLSGIVKGKVTDAESKTAIPGVSVINIETGITANTDSKGEFILPAESETKLSLMLVGYQKKEVEVVEGDSIQIVLKPINAALSEVVVVGYGSGKVKQSAAPKDGWAAFRKYLNENNELETNETGAVVVEFVINANGTLGDFKILKSLSKLADARAINLIRNYSSWQGSSDGTANKVKVTLRFK
jgi:TonB family protein